MPAPQGDGHYYWRWGITGHFIQNLMLDVRRNHAEVRQSMINTVMGELKLNLYDRVDLYAGVGTAKLEAKTALSTLYSSGVHRNNTLDLNFTTATAWTCGLKAKMVEWQNWYAGLGLSYFSYRPTLDFLVDNSTSSTHYLDLSAHYFSWIMALGGGYSAQISDTFMLKPHMSAIYGTMYANIDQRFVDLDGLTTIEISDLQCPYMWGYVLGVTLMGSDRFCLTAQMARLMYMGYSIIGTFPF